ncbi:MAG: hypothetical protein [Caudoviricetes sp.]|nr:MAG: hypothetical protein [Caudoviricetes sp.]
MKIMIGVALLLVNVSSYADNITMQLSSEFETNNRKKVCEYSNSMYDFTLKLNDYQDCPTVKTFDNSDSD